MSSRGNAFVKELVIGFGFLNGLWIHIGFNPEDAISQALLQILKSFSPSTASTVGLGLLIASIAILIVSVWASYRIGGIIGLVAVILGFIGGILLGGVGIFILIVGVILGGVAPDL